MYNHIILNIVKNKIQVSGGILNENPHYSERQRQNSVLCSATHENANYNPLKKMNE